MRLQRLFVFSSFITALLSAPIAHAGKNAGVSFFMSGRQVGHFSVSELKARVKTKVIQVVDPNYGKAKKYEVFPVRNLMKTVYGSSWGNRTHTVVRFVSIDDKEVGVPLSHLQEGGGYLAIRDMNQTNWETTRGGGMNPKPFYLVWADPAQTAARGYPWYGQIQKIELLRFEEHYAEIAPTGELVSNAVNRGFTIFRNQCLHCHSMNRQGANVGPDLNAPQSILAYRSAKVLKEFIRKPSTFRYSLMPDNTHLTDQDLNDLVEYFWFKKNQRESSQ